MPQLYFSNWMTTKDHQQGRFDYKSHTTMQNQPVQVLLSCPCSVDKQEVNPKFQGAVRFSGTVSNNTAFYWPLSAA